MPERRIPNYFLHWVPNRPRKNWQSCVIEDASFFTGVENINMEAAKQQATDRVQRREEEETNEGKKSGG